MEEITTPETPVTLPIDTPYNQNPHVNLYQMLRSAWNHAGTPAIINHSLSWWVWVVEILPLTRVWNASYCYRMDSESENNRSTILWSPWLQEGALRATNHGRGVRACVCVCVCVCARQFRCSTDIRNIKCVAAVLDSQPVVCPQEWHININSRLS